MEFAATQTNDKNIINENTKTADTKNPDINKILKELECWFKQLKESIKTSETQAPTNVVPLSKKPPKAAGSLGLCF